MHADTVLRQSVRRGIRATVLGILISSALAFVKVLSGVIGHSYALTADGVESLLDVLKALVVLGGLKIAASPPDNRYPFGYGKAEPLAGLVVAVALFGAAVGIGIESVRQIQEPRRTRKERGRLGGAIRMRGQSV
ncbi:MAG: cation diffusion facilitator family transporter [bacterium]